MKDENKGNYGMLAIVAIVAIVGIVVMFTGNNNAMNAKQDDGTVTIYDADGNLIGEGFRTSRTGPSSAYYAPWANGVTGGSSKICCIDGEDVGSCGSKCDRSGGECKDKC